MNMYHWLKMLIQLKASCLATIYNLNMSVKFKNKNLNKNQTLVIVFLLQPSIH
jgi:hypothetical protein